MGCTESIPDVSVFHIPINVHSSIPPLHPKKIPPSNDTTEIMIQQKICSFSNKDYRIISDNGMEFYGIHIQGKACCFGVRNQMALLDVNDIPIAVCLRQFSCLKQVFTIYTLEPLYYGQCPSGHDYYGISFYAYAQVIRRPCDTIQHVILDHLETPSFTIHRVGGLWSNQRMVKYYTHQPVALIEGGTCVVGSCNSYFVTINPGMDPCLIICLTAICDEMDKAEQQS